MEKFFKLKEHGTNVKTEIIAGITTFLAMAYILAVNPGYLGGIPGASPAAIFMATALSAAILSPARDSRCSIQAMVSCYDLAPRPDVEFVSCPRLDPDHFTDMYPPSSALHI